MKDKFCSMTHMILKELKKIFNWFLFLYIIVWFAFGYRYYGIANNDSSMPQFIYQDDMKLKLQIEGFRDYIENKYPNCFNRSGYKKRYIPSELIDKIVTSEVTKNKFRASDADVSIEMVGEDFAELYKDILYIKGITHFNLSKNNKKGSQNEANTYSLKLYHNDISRFTYTTKDLGDCKLVQKFDIRLAKTSPFYNRNKINSIHMLVFDLQYASFDYESIRGDLQRIIAGRYSYPLSDFLYFSAVTITTLGYGDILPNSREVRIMVMSETLFGIIIIGLYINSCFKRKEEKGP